MQRKLAILTALSATILTTSTAGAQDIDLDFDEIFAYTAIISTPVGAVAPVVTPSMAGESRRGLGVRAQYGRMSGYGASANTVLAGLDVGIGRGSIGASAGYRFVSCDDSELDCSGHFIAGASAEQRLASIPAGASTVGLGVSADFGYGKDDVATSLAASIGAPLSVTITSGRVQVVPFVAPALGWGRLSGDDPDSGDDVAESGTRFVLGGGIGILNVAPGLGINLGARKVFIDGGRTVFGAGLSWQGL